MKQKSQIRNVAELLSYCVLRLMQARDHWERKQPLQLLLSVVKDMNHFWVINPVTRLVNSVFTAVSTLCDTSGSEVCRCFQRMWSTRLHIENPAKVGCTGYGGCGLNGPGTIERWSWENKEQASLAVLNVIKRVMEHTAWFTSIVVTKKKFRICMDSKDLNQNLKHKHYQIPSGEEIISEMAVALLHTSWLVTRPLAAQTGWKQQQTLCLQYALWLVLSSCLLE